MFEFLACTQVLPARSDGTVPPHVAEVLQAAADLLRYKYKAWWPESLPVLGAIFGHVAGYASGPPPIMDGLVQSVAALCGSADQAGTCAHQICR